jgi:SecD/SecF fusion protein
MRNRGFILFFAITFALICAYSISFTQCTNRVENKAEQYAKNDPTALELKEQAGGNAVLESYLLDSSFKARESDYLARMSDSVVYNLLFAKWTYKECKALEINLGLDLKGGMNVMLEVSVPEIVKALAGSGAKDSLFVQTMKLATEKQKYSQTDFLTLFYQSFKEIAPANAKLATIFRKLSVNKTNPTNDDVIKALREETEAALDKTFFVLRSRIDRFGVTQPNIQRMGRSGRIMVELPGVKEPERVRKLLQGTANLEFWETYEFAEVRDYFIQLNDRYALLEAGTKDTTVNSEDAEIAKADTATVGLPKVEDDGIGNRAGETEADMIKKNPLLSRFQLNDQAMQRTDGKTGALVGYCHEKDTAIVNKILHSEIARTIFPQDLKLCWEAKTGKDKSSVARLVALKSKGEKGAVLDGRVVVDAKQDFTDRAGNEISMSMNQEGAQQWAKITEQNKGRCIAIVLDNLVYSYPTVNDAITGGRSSITGQFSIEEAKDLANLLKAGKLPAPAVIVSEEIVGPTLGKETINSSMISFIMSFVLVMFYMFFFYNRAGITAGLALLVNVLFVFGVLASLTAVLTLPGIAGIVLTLGIAVDANVIIYERVKEEVRAGKAIRLSIADGYKAALPAIIDANLTSIITGIILYIFGSGPVQGFATTLIIGTLTSMFTAIFITRLIFTWEMDRNIKLSFGNRWTINAFTNTKIDFLAYRKVFYTIAISILLIGVGSIVGKGIQRSPSSRLGIEFKVDKAFDLGIDFAGGRSYTLRFDQPVKTNELRDALTDKFDGVAPEVKTFGTNNQIKITTKWKVHEDNTTIDSIAEAKLYEGLKPFFKADLSKADFSVQNQNLGLISSQKIGATVSRDITRGAFLAVFFCLFGIFLYIVLRFRNWQYGLGAVVSLLNAALFTIGMFSLLPGLLPFSMEIDQAFIAAVLTVIGYSINDGVVIFDRIRENRRLYPKRDLKETINSSLNSTLGRSINITGTVLVMLLAIFLFGGTVIRGFVFALLIGIAYGSTSSLCIGASLIYDTSKKKSAEVAK